MKFCEYIPNSVRNKNLKRLILNQLERVVFWPPEHYTPSRSGEKKLFL
jgi:hypothetical protein